MKCRKAKNAIVNYADLDEAQRERVDKHLKSCPDCLSEFHLHQKSLNLVKEIISFNRPEDYWRDYQVDVRRKLPSLSLWRKLLGKTEDFTSLIKTPLFGSIPAYAFSAVLLLFLAVGLYPTLSSPKRAEGFDGDLVVYEGELLSAIDHGGVTIYRVGTR
jgi:hypothetical protein